MGLIKWDLMVRAMMAIKAGERLSNQYNIVNYCKKFVNARYPEFPYCGGVNEKARRARQRVRGLI